MKPTVLFVDDDANAQTLVANAVRETAPSWNLRHAVSGHGALQILSECTVDVLVASSDLLDMSGAELASQLEQCDDWHSVPVILLVDFADTDAVQRALDAEAFDIVDRSAGFNSLHCAQILARIRSANRYRLAQSRVREQSQRLIELEYSRFELVAAFSQTTEPQDADACSHTLRVGFYSKLIAKRLGLDSEFQNSIQLAGALHDVGKLGLPDALNLKTGAFGQEERQAMQVHCTFGRSLLAPRPGFTELAAELTGFESAGDYSVLGLAAIIAHQHHERWDGSGYPQRLAGDQIHVAARIVSVADTFDALTTRRAHKAAIPMDDALSIMRSDAGTHFDPIVFEAFLGVFEEIADFCRKHNGSALSRVAA